MSEMLTICPRLLRYELNHITTPASGAIMATLAGGWNNNQNYCAENFCGDRPVLACVPTVRGIGDNLTQVALPATHLNSTVNDSITSSEPCDGGGDYAVPSTLVPTLPIISIYEIKLDSLRPERDLLPFIMCELIW